MTIHSWGAVTPGMTNIDRQISCIKTCKPAHQRWKATKVLVIDEGLWKIISGGLGHQDNWLWTDVKTPQSPWLMDNCSRCWPPLRIDCVKSRTDRSAAFRYLTTHESLISQYITQCFILQVVVTGDFFQLPPITKGNAEPFFAFECEAWTKCIEHTVTLTQVYRQTDTRELPLSQIVIARNARL